MDKYTLHGPGEWKFRAYPKDAEQPIMEFCLVLSRCTESEAINHAWRQVEEWSGRREDGRQGLRTPFSRVIVEARAWDLPEC